MLVFNCIFGVSVDFVFASYIKLRQHHLILCSSSLCVCLLSMLQRSADGWVARQLCGYKNCTPCDSTDRLLFLCHSVNSLLFILPFVAERDCLNSCMHYVKHEVRAATTHVIL